MDVNRAARRPDAVVAVTVTERCVGCGACLVTCPERAIRVRREASAAGREVGSLLVVDELCTGCGECVEICPVDAIEETSR